MAVLIVTMPQDSHALGVRWAIQQLGGKCDILYPFDLADGALWSLSSDQDSLRTSYKGLEKTYCLRDYQSVWMRRPPKFIPQAQLTNNVERAVSEEEFGILVESVYAVLENRRFAVNTTHATKRGAQKPYQMTQAAAAGFMLPDTLVTNSRHEVLDFFRRQKGEVVYKPLKSGVWRVERDSQTQFNMVPTTKVSEELIRSADISASPGIYQRCIDKRGEVRATVMGRSVFSWLTTFERSDLDVDWRLMKKSQKVERFDLPIAIEKACFDLMDRLELVFGCFDIAIDQEGNFYFLEVNPQGQWLFGDLHGIGINQLEGMAQFLMSANPDFRYDLNDTVGVRGADKVMDELVKEDGAQHYGHWVAFNYLRLSFHANPATAQHLAKEGEAMGQGMSFYPGAMERSGTAAIEGAGRAEDTVVRSAGT